MADSLSQKEGSPFWYAYIRINGKRTQRSTKQTDRTKAEEVLAKWKKIERAESTASDHDSGAVYEILRRAVDEAVAGRLTETRGMDFISEILEVSNGRRLELVTVGKWSLAWLKEVKANKSADTYLRYEGVIRGFREFVGPEKLLLQVTRDNCLDYHHAQRRTKGAASSNNGIKIVRTFFNRAIKRGYLSANPADACDLYKESKIEKDTFTIEQIAALLANADADWKGIILCGLFTGANLRDICRLKWDQFDLDVGLLSYARQKTSVPVVMPLHPELLRWLKERRGPKAKGFIFPDQVEQGASGKSGLSMRFSRIMEAAGVEGRTIEPDRPGGRRRRTLTFHSLRHTMNSILANRGIPQEVRMKLTGHKSESMNSTYTHHELETLRDAVDVLPALAV